MVIIILKACSTDDKFNLKYTNESANYFLGDDYAQIWW